MSKLPTMQHCAYCGAELGVYVSIIRDETCGKRECERWSRDQDAAEREEAHRALDESRGWS